MSTGRVDQEAVAAIILEQRPLSAELLQQTHNFLLARGGRPHCRPRVFLRVVIEGFEAFKGLSCRIQGAWGLFL